MKKILFASAECAPFVKTGGLGAVVGSLPKQLNHKKYDRGIIVLIKSGVIRWKRL